MKQLVQIVYISRSTTAPGGSGKGVDPAVARILAKSRANNRKNGLVGVLFFGDGCFFQCLEGEEEAVDTLYAKLLQDDRHKDLKIIARNRIEERSFESWTMKYVPVEQAMSRLLQSRQMSTFDPYRFDQGTMQEVLKLLLSANGASEPSEPAARSEPVLRPAPHVVAPRSIMAVGAVSMTIVVASAALFIYFFV